ncbi:NAD(P)-dependent dehydrogenase, short-chain alcohol dehydrogenase family [Sphingomonas laterariae]|uniref:NAD(P)-dependent dehydrogenase, short-chain alcohol dehydrogenase family n=1 Tax=Edaphosphingomonas laterariae TaxID=861865 RepID=A0A239GXI6_9SPHN|nr:SDR family NAD(P)-dependent oxidoreductase [Sphingomonas laterariae]SNS73223.1 NAD(P)-dependent dehydrogenase, short-chain alcohol dehydrogenase family [Sphingomonas laterariae]
MAGRIAGKTALVTGASGGIGAATAIRLASEGAVVVCHGRNEGRTVATAEAIRAQGGTAHVVIGELSGDAGPAAIVDATRAAVSDVDILVNNAGGESAGGGTAGWFDTSPADWLATYDSNVGSMIRLIHAFTSAMRERRWGRLIQLSSGVVDVSMPIIPDYQGAKAAIRNLTVSLSKALSGTGITANSVSPGFVLTDGNRPWIIGMAERNGITGGWEEIERWAVRKFVPNHSGRLGRPEDIANTIAFLADPASDYVNGTDILVDGGH